jgi:hypothetical protein
MPGTLKRVQNLVVKGFANTKTPITYNSTIRWTIVDDSGKYRDIIIPNTYYVPDCGVLLLSPQHWAQEVKDNFPEKDGTFFATFNNRVEL